MAKTYNIRLTALELEALSKGKQQQTPRTEYAWLTANQKLLVAHTQLQTKQPDTVFETTEKAFRHFLEHVYPGLKPHQKIRYKDARYDFLTRGSISLNKMEGILADYAIITKEIKF